MRKKVWILFIILLLCGCQAKKEEIIPPVSEEKVEEPIEIKVEYQDLNTAPISFYQLKGNQLIRLDSISDSYQGLDDVGLFQIYPSREEVISLTNTFANSYYEEFQKYPNIKVGFSLSFTLDTGEEVFFNILNPTNTMEKWEYFMAYLYDDYHNQGKSFYSHIENDEYNESTLFTAIKLQCGGYFNRIHSPVLFTVYTYDSEDDFLEGHYRGNSQSTLTICMNGLC